MKPEELEVKAAAELAKQQAFDVRLFTCSSTGCQSSEALGVIAGLKAEIKARQFEGKVQVNGSGCMGLCSKGPLVRMTSKTQKDILFSEIKPEMAATVVEQVVVPVLEGKKIEKPGGDLERHTLDLNDPFFAMQVYSVLENNGKMDPEKLDDYIARDGYQGAAQSADHERRRDMQGDARQRPARPRRRGFPTGLKWDLTRKVQSDDQVRHLQRRRGRPWRVHGPLGAGRRSARGD